MKSFIALSVFVAIATAAPQSRIMNGKDAADGQFPHHVGIGSSDYFPWCAGSLVHTNLVVTAAHCIGDEEALYLIFGVTKYDDPEAVKRVVTKRAVHKNFDPKTLHNDVALLYVEEGVELTDKIQTIQISWLRLHEDDVITVSGWGSMGHGQGAPRDLKFTELTVISNEKCTSIFPGLLDSVFCCDAQEKSTCSGDSGGPAVQYHEEHGTLLVGVVSFGSAAGCELGYPVGFSRAEDFYPWILETVEEWWPHNTENPILY